MSLSVQKWEVFYTSTTIKLQKLYKQQKTIFEANSGAVVLVWNSASAIVLIGLNENLNN